MTLVKFCWQARYVGVEFVTDPEMIAQYITSEEKREAWFKGKGKDFVPDVPSDQLLQILFLQRRLCSLFTFIPLVIALEGILRIFEVVASKRSHDVYHDT